MKTESLDTNCHIPDKYEVIWIPATKTEYAKIKIRNKKSEYWQKFDVLL